MCKALLGMVLSGLLLASPLSAFKGKEHAELTNLALKVALLRAQELHPEHKEIWAQLEADLLGSEAFKKESSFGNVTAVVDLVFFPEKLFVSPQDCADEALKVEKVCSVCGEQDPLTPECDEAILTQGKDRMKRKQRQRIVRSLLSARLNSKHFDAGAQEAYNKFHARALRQIRDRSAQGGPIEAKDWHVALRTEAVALHFLEDFFAPGHIMTRRQAHEDLASRALHNRYNAKGIEAALGNLTLLKELGRVLDQALNEGPDGKRDLDLAGGTRKLIEKDLRFAGGLFDSPQAAPYFFYGDGDLHKDKARVQRVLLLLLAAYSIEEVLKEGISGTEPEDRRLTLCYRPWSAEPGPNSDQPDLDTTCRPWGAAALLSPPEEGASQEKCWQELANPVSDPPTDPVSQAPELTENLLVGYPYFLCPTKDCKGIGDSATDERGTWGENYVHWTPALSVARYGLARRGDESNPGTSWDVDFIASSNSVEEIEQRRGCEFLGKKFSRRSGLGKLMASLVSVGYSQTRSSDLEVSSWTLASQVPTLRWKYEINNYYRVHFAYSEYSGPDLKSAAKPGIGLRYGIGVSFIFVEGGVELGYVMDRPGHLDETAIFTLGVRAQYSLRP